MTITISTRSIATFLAGMIVAVITVFMFRALTADAVGGDEVTFVPVTACRLIDTRPADLRVGPHGPLGPDNTKTVVAHGSNGQCMIPASATGLSLNVTALGATEATFLTFWDQGSRPNASSLNPAPGQPPTPNGVNIPLSPTGTFEMYNRVGAVDAIIDVTGYYTNSGLVDLEARITALESLTASMSIETVNGQPAVRFSGVNFQVVDGSGGTWCDGGQGLCNGRGNVFIGYQEDVASDGPDLHSGSHNLVIGTEHEFTNHSGLVAGFNNTVSGAYSSVTGGAGNTASGGQTSVTGGSQNTATDSYASVSGGTQNDATADYASVSGGAGNTASGTFASVSGGQDNTASGNHASVSGGGNNSAIGHRTSVSAGYTNNAVGEYDSVVGGDNLTCHTGTGSAKAAFCGEGFVNAPDVAGVS